MRSMVKAGATTLLAPVLLALAWLACAAPAMAADGPATAASRAAYQAAAQQSGAESDQALGAEVALANALISEDALAEGVDHLKHIRTVIVARSGPDAPEALIIEATTAIATVNGGDPAGGEAIARDAVERSRRTRGENDVVTIISKAALGTALALQGRYAEAYPLLQAGYDGMGAAFGVGSLQTRQIGTVLQNVTAALGYDAEALALRRKLAEPPPAGSPEALVLLAAGQQLPLLNTEGRHAEAQALGEPLVARLTALRGAGHTSTLEAMAGLASAHAGQGRWDQAADLARKVYDGYVRARGRDDMATLSHGDTLGLYLTKSSDVARRRDGRALLISIIEQRRKLYGPHVPQVVLAEVWLGVSALEEPQDDPRKTMDEVFRWLLEADRDIAADPAQADSQTAQAVNVLIGVQLINQGEGQAAYDRLSHAARVVRARYGDRRVAATGADATQELTDHRYIFIGQVRAGWLLAHQP